MVASHPKYRLMVDFDGTLTVNDTTALLTQVGLDWQTTQGREPPSWDFFSKEYTKDLESHNAVWKPTSSSDLVLPKGLPRPFREAMEYQRSLASVEETSAQRVLRSAFADLPKSEIERAANAAIHEGRVHIRNGTIEMFALAQARALDVELLSVNWSSTWVRACLRSAAMQAGDAAAAEAVDSAYIAANETPFIKDDDAAQLHNSLHVGASSKGIRTGVDKLQHLEGRREALRLEQQSPLLAYIGDSVTDAGCLVAADAGICIRDDPMRSGQRDLSELLESKSGFTVDEGAPGGAKSHQATAPESRNLLYARDIRQVLAWLGLRNSN